MAQPMEVDKVEIDESLYSRQEIMLGKAAMQKMAVSNVFVSGIGGLGVEIAKNIALAGVKNLTLHDTKSASWLDLSTQFYLSEKDIGKNRAEVSLTHISQLNPYVKYSLSHDDLSTIDLSYFNQFKCVIITDAPLPTLLRINDYCHSNNIAFISADVRGVFTWVFTDFGTKFEVHDKNGEENKQVLVGNISNAANAVVDTLEKTILHGFEDGDSVTFSEVRGMSQINGQTFKIKVTSPSQFTIGDTSSFGTFEKGYGIAQQVKDIVELKFKSLRESIADPDLVISDFAKMEAPMQIHVAHRALDEFVQVNSRFPNPWDAKDAEQMVEISKKISADNTNESLVKTLSFTAQGSIVGLTAFTGGVVAQECLKSLSGKYTPLQQYLYLDASEVVPDLTSSPSDFHPENNRYDATVICLGKSTVKSIGDVKTFMIGCGAIGCEMLKNFAMLGVGAGSNGHITVTDNDLIEKSNLNRQFLFRPKDIQKPKSETASRVAKEMNSEIKITAFLDKVGPDTEEKYSDKFFEGLDFVVNALDNVNARLYVDSRCVTTKRALLESGTLGPKGHVQIVIPHFTESYGSQRDPPEKDVPFCTLKSFPNQIEHCIEWARDFSFGGLFVSKPMQWKQLIEENRLVEKLNDQNSGGIDFKVMRTGLKLIRTKPKTFEDCIAFARNKFEQYYVNKTIQLLHNFPLDHKVDDKGTLFWSSPKRPPKEVVFDFEDSVHRGFVMSLANLLAEVYGLERHTNVEKFRETLKNVQVPKFVPKSKKIETDEKKKKEEVESTGPVEEDINDVRLHLLSFFKANPNPFKLKNIEFEKDDDTNFHIDFISACANLRARMYSIPEVERLKVKAIAGRIMPAIATTTAAVSGLVSIELIKLVKKLAVDKFKNLFMNLAVPFWSFSEPGPAEKKKLTEKIHYTLWDSWEIKEGDITLGQLIDHFQSRFNLEVSGVFNGAVMVYVPLFPGHAKRKTSKMSALLKRTEGIKYLDLVITFANEKGDDVSGPPVRFWFDK